MYYVKILYSFSGSNFYVYQFSENCGYFESLIESDNTSRTEICVFMAKKTLVDKKYVFMANGIQTIFQ